MEDVAKRALQGFAKRSGQARATADAVCSFVFFKLERQYMHHLAAAWFIGESLLAWLNPLYVPRFVTNRVCARMAVRRTLVSEAVRSVRTVVNRHTIQGRPALKAFCSVGLNADQLQDLEAKRAHTASSGLPKTHTEKDAWIAVCQRTSLSTFAWIGKLTAQDFEWVPNFPLLRREATCFGDAGQTGLPEHMYTGLSRCQRFVSGAAYPSLYMGERRFLRAAPAATCEEDVAQGLPDFIGFDNGPAYCLYALTAMEEVWPQVVYWREQPPCRTAAAWGLHTSLRREAVAIVSDTPRRRWHWQNTLPCESPDYSLFDQCLAFALARTSASIPESI